MTFNGFTLLCVDDEINVLNALKRLLKREAFRVVTATGPMEGIEILRGTGVNVVLADYKMPGMNGLDFLLEVKKHDPGIVRMILTGYAHVKVAQEALNRECADFFLLKPWDGEALKQELRKAFSRCGNFCKPFSFVKKNSESILCQTALETIPIAVALVTRGHELVFSNRIFQELLEGQDLCGELSPEMVKLIDEVLATGEAGFQEDYLVGAKYRFVCFPVSVDEFREGGLLAVF